MKKIILLLFLISIPFAQALESGKAYIVSSINVNSNKEIESGQSYSLVPKIVVATGSENYAGSVTPFTGCYGGKRYESGEEKGNCLTGVVNSLNSTSETDALSAAQGKVLNDRISELASDMNSLKIGDAGGENYFDPVRDNVSGVIVEDRNTNKIRIRGQGSPRRVSELIPAGTYYISGTFTGA